MRNFRFSFIIIILMILSAGNMYGQKPFKGRIIYNVSYAGSNIDLAELHELPVKATTIIKNHQARTELSGQNASLSQVKISDGENREIITLLDILREKYVIRRNFQEIENALKNMPQAELEFTNETKEILGYDCKKAIARVVDVNGVEHQSVIYYTTQISGNALNFDIPYFEVPGLMLEYELRVGALNIKYEAQSIRKKVFVGSKNFKVPKEYQETNYDELRSRLQGNF